MPVDLHVHTTASDGTFQPREAAACAHDAGLDAIAITDHDTVQGIAEAREAGAKFGLQVVAGVELGCDLRRRELHILGYLFRQDDPRLVAKLGEMARDRTSRAREIVRRLQKLGVPLPWEDVAALAAEGTVGRLHIARALLAGGWVGHQHEAFAKYLDKDKPAYVPRLSLPPGEAIALIHRSGGVAVLAHPKLIGDDKVIPEVAAAGLDGLEVYHTRHSWHDVAKYKKMARELGLLFTGGSDCHGPAGKGEVLLGKILAPAECLIALQERAKEIQATENRRVTAE